MVVELSSMNIHVHVMVMGQWIELVAQCDKDEPGCMDGLG